jgi:hypothetical protein
MCYNGLMEAKKSVYIETTIPSYGSAREPKSLLNKLRKAQTLRFWNIRDRFRLFISQDVIDEISAGDPEAAARRREFIKGIEILPKPEALDSLAIIYQRLTGIPERAKTDCWHLAYAVLTGMDYLLSWNMVHLGPQSQEKIAVYNSLRNLKTPILGTPEFLYNAYQEEKDYG